MTRREQLLVGACARCGRSLPPEDQDARRGPKRTYCGPTCRKAASRHNGAARRIHAYARELRKCIESCGFLSDILDRMEHER